MARYNAVIKITCECNHTMSIKVHDVGPKHSGKRYSSQLEEQTNA